MTTDRPYRSGLSQQDAIAQVREGRGTQFHPVVVDAFFKALRRRPADFAPDAPVAGAPPTALAG
jgi:HD-GYP domain-containing protein (c-di-GMP phosphodiesterase class II)